MQLSSLEQLITVAAKTNFAIFELPSEIVFADIMPNAYHLRAQEDKKGILVEQVRELGNIVNSKQSSDLYIVVEEAENMVEAAANTFLKTLEEPRDLVHFVFLTRNSSALLPTIRSRAHCFRLESHKHITDAPEIDPEILDLAKTYISLDASSVASFADKIAKTKPNTQRARQKALEILDAAIVLLYKSYFKTNNAQFLKKLESLLKTEEAIRQNGNLKLQLIAGVI